jgi:SAM-dependent methyltransferase
MPLDLYEPISEQTFDAEAYLLANPDVGGAGLDALTHFQKHGRNEKRRQVSREILDPASSYRRRKFERFQPLIALDERVAEPDRLPMVFGPRHFSRADYASESANPGFGPFAQEIQANPGKNYLDLGCGLRPVVHDNCLYLEVYPSITADLIVEPDCTYPIRSGTLDGIGCFAVLEHTARPWQVVTEMRRMLKTGGKVFIDWPFLQPVHGFPSHFFNATREGLKSLFAEGFEIQEARTYANQTPDHTISWILGKLIRDLPSRAKRERVLKMSVMELISEPPNGEFWTWLLADAPDTLISEFACGNSLIGVKKG